MTARAGGRIERAPSWLWAGLPAALLLIFGIDCALAVRRGWNPARSRVELAVVAAAGLLVLALAVVELPPLRRWMAARWRPLLTMQAALVVSLVVAESALALLGDRIERQPFHAQPRGLRQVFTPTIPGTSPTARFSVNSIGLRGPEPPADRRVYRIVAVGGSTTEEVYLDDAATWTHLLMERLNQRGGRRYWVASAGRSGYATVEHLGFIAKSSLLDDVDAVVTLVGINDLARFVWGEAADRAVEAPAPRWSRLRCVELLRLGLSSRLAPHGLVMDRNALFVRNAQTRRAEARFVDRTVDPGPYLAAYGERLSAIAAACRRRGLTIVFADQPTLFKVSLSPDEERRLWLLRRSDGTYLPASRMRELMDRFNEVTRTTARRLGVPFVELSDLDGKSELFYDDCHFTEAGARQVAARIATSLEWPALPFHG